MNNWQKYFGTPERAARTRVTYWGEPERVTVEHRGRTVADDIPARKYRKWLESEEGADNAC